MYTRSHNFKVLPIVYNTPFKLHPEDGFMKAETL